LYDQSCLTQLLRAALQGSCSCAVLALLTPVGMRFKVIDSCHFTTRGLSQLCVIVSDPDANLVVADFAQRFGRVHNMPKVNVDLIPSLIRTKPFPNIDACILIDFFFLLWIGWFAEQQREAIRQARERLELHKPGARTESRCLCN
jgi:hypothetical protein